VLAVAVLGSLDVTRDGVRVAVPIGKTSELVVRLALEAGKIVRADRLVEDLWGSGPPATTRNTLQSKVAMLRRALGDPDAITSRGGGYALAVDAAHVDALAALDAAAAAARLLADGSAQDAADLSRSTLALYRGEVLQGAGEGDWAAPHRTRLEETRIRLVEIHFAARLALDDLGGVIGELETAVATTPFQESLWELLMTAQYRSGRQAEALASYQKVRTQLATELGLDPRPQLQELEQRILAQDPLLEVDAFPLSRRQAQQVRTTGNLPSMAVNLVGRDVEVAAIVHSLGENRLVEIVGPGGIGKTAAAIAVGRMLAASSAVGTDGVWLARLESAATADQVLDVLVSAVDGPGGESALFERLRASSALVILDNCEHVIDAAAALAIRLLDAAPGMRILCTSQVALDIDGEVVLELAPLELSHAVELFTRHATARGRTASAGADGGSVLEVCRSLDGLPLAIELAAARTRTLSVGEINRRLADRFRLLSDPTSRRPERRRSLKSTIAWSYDLLFPDDKRGLWALATFSGGAPLSAVESVLEALDVPAAAAIDVVGRLANRSLVMVDEHAEPPASGRSSAEAVVPTRYRLLDSIRVFALEEMAAAGLTERARAAHAKWCAEVAASSTAGVRSAQQADHLLIARTERANIDAALDWSATYDPRLALSIAEGFGWAWVVLGDSRGAQRLLRALEVSGGAAADRERGGALLLAAWIEASTGDLRPARRHVAAARELADATSDIELQARCSYYLAYVVSHHAEFRTALELTDHSRAVYDTMDRPWDQAANELFAARAAISAGEEGRGIDAVDRVCRWLRELEDPWLQVRGEAIQGELARLQHRFDDAVLHIGRAARTSGRLGFQQTEAFHVLSLGRAQCQAGDYDSGMVTLEIAIDKAQATGDVRLTALARVHLGRVLRALGDLPRARVELQAAARWHRDAGGGEQAALGECVLAAIEAADDVPGAPERLQGLLDDATALPDAAVEVLALDALARIAATYGDTDTARDLLDAADRRFGDASHLITDRDRADARWVRQTA
jgi:predicted ATPase/DNA-binding SARP family transcriptional activator